MRRESKKLLLEFEGVYMICSQRAGPQCPLISRQWNLSPGMVMDRRRRVH